MNVSASKNVFMDLSVYLYVCLPLISVNGGFSNWSAYGACSKSCGAGTKTRTRKCNNPAPAYGGANCVGDTTQSTACKFRECPGGYCCYVSVILHKDNTDTQIHKIFTSLNGESF